ncbi:carboxypeptidase regulatory-like domain-containing protein [Flavisolibacter sp. BT320]|nr:carboxypeptidase regulatory-like domain-containing protein [Flavisolibacter longurius]
MKSTRILLVLLLSGLSLIIGCRKPTDWPDDPTKNGTLKGTVFSPNGKIALPAVTVETVVNGAKATTLTDKNGTFELELPAGEYTITMYAGSGAHFSARKNVTVRNNRITELAAGETRLAFTGKIAYLRGSFDNIQSLVEKMGIPTTQLSLTDIADYNVLKQYDLLLMNCNSGYIDFETDKLLDRYLKEGNSIYASDLELAGLSEQDWGFIPSNLISYNMDGEVGITEADVQFESFKKALGKNKMLTEFDMPLYVQITRLSTADPRSTVLVDHPQKGPLALKIQWGTARTSAQGHRFGGNIIYTTFHDAVLSDDVKAVLQQMILQL